jgi:hypothetical protein
MHTTDVPLSAEERLREIAGILAAGLLRLRTPACAALTLGAAGRRPQQAATSDISGEHAGPQESEESARKPLAFASLSSTDPHAG